MPGPLGILLPLCPQKPWQPGQVAGGHCQDEARPHPFNATIDGLGWAADGLGPAEGLLDPLSMLDGQGIALVSSGSSVDCGMPRFLGDMRSDAGPAQIGHEASGIIGLVSAHRQFPG